MNNIHKGLSAWQLTMLALGTVIGGSFFLGSSVAIHAAGPSVVITYIVGGVLVYYILFALSEMTVANPDTGSFRTYAAQIFGPGTGFVVGWFTGPGWFWACRVKPPLLPSCCDSGYPISRLHGWVFPLL